jgi:5-methylcytosine-specific restriction endonuclease McrA
MERLDAIVVMEVVRGMSPVLFICTAPGCGNYLPCAVHPSPKGARGQQHRRARAQTLLEETRCWICGKPGTRDDPLTADHVVPRVHGGADSRDNMRAAHESCNKRRGEGRPYAPEEIPNHRTGASTFRALLAVCTGSEAM